MKFFTMFEQYPKTKPQLPAAYKAIYDEHFLHNRKGLSWASSMTSRAERWMHRQIAADVGADSGEYSPTLELGAGTLNHLRFEPYVRPYDIVEPNQKPLDGTSVLRNIRHVYKTIFEVPEEQTYQRIISIATLEHLEDLPFVVARCGVHLKEGGTFRAGIPNEGTVLWTAGSRLTSGLQFFLRYRLDYSILMRYEHVNTAEEIDQVLRYFFKKVGLRVCGVSRRLAFYRFYECSRPDIARCLAYCLKKDNKEKNGC